MKTIKTLLLGGLIGLSGMMAGCGGGGAGPEPATLTTPTAATLSIGTSKASVKSDNSETVELTIYATTSANAAVQGVVISLSADGGVLSAATATTDPNGKAIVNFGSGVSDKSNRTVTITATAGNVTTQIPITIAGTTTTLQSSTNSLVVGGSGTLTVTVNDAGGQPVSLADVTLSAPAGVSIGVVTGKTDSNGRYQTSVTGASPGTVTVTAAALGAASVVNLNVSGPAGASFGITSPSDLNDTTQMTTGGAQSIVVSAPTQSHVRFATTVGYWTGVGCPGTPTVCIVAVSGGIASATFNSTLAGIANIQVDGLNSGAVSATDTYTMAITSSTASSISIQSSVGVLAPSVGGTSNTATLIATVRDSANQLVGGSPVAFSINNPTGGGENIAPVIKLSSDGTCSPSPCSPDPLGQARATFTSGSLPSAQTGVIVQAQVVSTAISATTNIVIGGTAGSVAIGQGTKIAEDTTSAYYTYPMSVLVSDANGNAVKGASVSLGAWPVGYAKGVWIEADGKCGPSYTEVAPADPSLVTAVPGEHFRRNEDANENLILDLALSEDDNGDTFMQPNNSDAGALPQDPVTTNDNGVATFNLTFLKTHAAWVQTRIRASTIVQGTQINSSIVLNPLPWLKSDSDNCLLADSPYNIVP